MTTSGQRYVNSIALTGEFFITETSVSNSNEKVALLYSISAEDIDTTDISDITVSGDDIPDFYIRLKGDLNRLFDIQKSGINSNIDWSMNEVNINNNTYYDISKNRGTPLTLDYKLLDSSSNVDVTVGQVSIGPYDMDNEVFEGPSNETFTLTVNSIISPDGDISFVINSYEVSGGKTDVTFEVKNDPTKIQHLFKYIKGWGNPDGSAPNKLSEQLSITYDPDIDASYSTLEETLITELSSINHIIDSWFVKLNAISASRNNEIARYVKHINENSTDAIVDTNVFRNGMQVWIKDTHGNLEQTVTVEMNDYNGNKEKIYERNVGFVFEHYVKPTP